MSSSSFWADSLFLTTDEVASDELEGNEDVIVTEVPAADRHR
jgi:hypothetical protein